MSGGKHLNDNEIQHLRDQAAIMETFTEPAEEVNPLHIDVINPELNAAPQAPQAPQAPITQEVKTAESKTEHKQNIIAQATRLISRMSQVVEDAHRAGRQMIALPELLMMPCILDGRPYQGVLYRGHIVHIRNSQMYYGGQPGYIFPGAGNKAILSFMGRFMVFFNNNTLHIYDTVESFERSFIFDHIITSICTSAGVIALKFATGIPFMYFAYDPAIDIIPVRVYQDDGQSLPNILNTPTGATIGLLPPLTDGQRLPRSSRVIPIVDICGHIGAGHCLLHNRTPRMTVAGIQTRCIDIGKMYHERK